MAILQYVETAKPGSWTRAAIGLINSGGIRASIIETMPGGSMYIDIISIIVLLYLPMLSCVSIYIKDTVTF